MTLGTLALLEMLPNAFYLALLISPSTASCLGVMLLRGSEILTDCCDVALAGVLPDCFKIGFLAAAMFLVLPPPERNSG